MRARPRRNAPASSLFAAAAGFLTVVLVVGSGVARAGQGPFSEPAVAAPRWQPPEQPPAQPPEPPPPPQPPGEEEEAEAPEAPAEAESPTEESVSDETPAGEAPGEAAPEGGETEGEEPEEDGGGSGRRAPEVVAAPAGILPGRMMAAPAPAPGASVIGMILEDDGFLLHAASGEVIAYEPDGQAARWGLPEAGAAFVARDSETVVLLDRNGDVALRRISDGVRVGGFSSGFVPDHASLAGSLPESEPASEPEWEPASEPGSEPVSELGPAPAALADGVLYWVSAGTLRGFRIPAGNPVLEVELPDGEASSVVVAPAGDASAEAHFPLLLVSLGSGGLVAVASSPGTTGGVVRWQAAGAGPVTGPALVFPAEQLAFFGDEGGDLTAVHLETGRQRWRWRLAEGFHHPPLLSRGRLYAATKANSLYCFDAKRGGERWRAALPGRPAASPLRIAGAVVVVTQDGLLVEVNAETGARIGRPRDLDAEVLGVVRRLGDGASEEGWRERRLFLGLRDGRLAVFGPRIGGEAP